MVIKKSNVADDPYRVVHILHRLNFEFFSCRQSRGSSRKDYLGGNRRGGGGSLSHLKFFQRFSLLLMLLLILVLVMLLTQLLMLLLMLLLMQLLMLLLMQ